MTKKTKATSVNLRLDSELKESLALRAMALDCSVGEIARIALKSYLSGSTIVILPTSVVKEPQHSNTGA